MIDTIPGIKYDESTKHTHILSVSAESQIQRFQNWRYNLHITYLCRQAPHLSEMAVSYRGELLRDSVRENKFMTLCSAARMTSFCGVV